MPMRVHAKAPDLKKLARDLKQAGRKDLQKELYSALNRATKPVRAEIKANAMETLPKAGGLNRRVAAANISVNGSGGKVRIIARPSKRGGQFDPEGTDLGTVEHPTYGHAPTVSQSVKPGWFTLPIARAAGLTGTGEGTVVEELLDAIDTVAAKLADG